MLAHIEKIRQRPKHQRTLVQFGSTLAIMSVIVFVWATSQIGSIEEPTVALAHAEDGAVLLGQPEPITTNRPLGVMTATVAEAGKEISEIFNQAIDAFVSFRDQNF